MSAHRTIFCCGCQQDVSARLSHGGEIYPHRADLASLPFWKCDACGNFVGCHHKTKDRTRPLGCIPTPDIKRVRMKIHEVLDPIWKQGRMRRGAVYAELATRLGLAVYHTAELRSYDQAVRAYEAVIAISDEIRATGEAARG